MYTPLKSVRHKSVCISKMAEILHQARNRFIWISWESNHTNRINKTAIIKKKKVINPFHGKLITKRYVIVARNDFNFENSVRNEMERREEPRPDYVCEERAWGSHIDKTPFVIHQTKEDDVLRLHLHLLPIKYHETSETGYYVKGRKIDDDLLKPFIPVRKKGETTLDEVRYKVHPINARLEDVLVIKVDSTFYHLIMPTNDEIQEIAEAAKPLPKQKGLLF